jgi:hypothetical protein
VKFKDAISKYNNWFSYLLLTFIVLALVSGVLGYLSVLFDFKLLRLWKELFTAVLLICALVLTFSNKKFGIIKWLLVTAGFFIIMSVLSLRHSNLSYIIYQFKIDGFIFLFGIAAYYILNNLNREQFIDFLKRLTHVILLLGILNVLAMCLEHVFMSQWLNFLGGSQVQENSSSGIKIVTNANILRAPGLLLGFVPSGVLMVFCIILLIESYRAIKVNKILFTSALVLFLVGLAMSTYKTGFIGLAIYLFIKGVLLFIHTKKYKQIFLHSVVGLIFLLSFLSTHFMIFYTIVNRFSPYYAYGSILLRIQQHIGILRSMNNPLDLLFGVGMGVNGVYGIEKAPNTSALDSLYIYLMSNYGLLATIIITGIMFYLVYTFFKNKEYDFLGAGYLIIYVLASEYFYNNIIANFPMNFVLMLIIVATIICRQKSITIKNFNV